ncbi:MAG: GNAT family N-acetyltransferase, partial [Actinomycetota bacterium]|nr:GNAT family N-acetyltransferase [Actinomycetota bacterium]
KLMVSSTDRHRGVATRLMAAAVTAARGRGLSLLTLECVAGGTQQDFYEALGYTAVGTIPDFSLSPNGRPQGTTTLYQQLS